MSSIVFEGNTYTFGATVSANSGTGTTSYVFGGLSSGWTYGFIIWAFNGVGPSSIVGPIIKKILGESLESRQAFSAFAWNWQTYNGPYQTFQDWSVYGLTSGPDSGSTLNYFVSSEDMGNTNWFAIESGNINRPSWLNILRGITDPFGGTSAIVLNTNGPPTNSLLSYGQNISYFPSGSTWILSMYINVDGSTGNWELMNAWVNGFGTSYLRMRQILPVGASSGSFTLPTYINYVNGQTGWQRFAWEFYATPYTGWVGDVLGKNIRIEGITWDRLSITLMRRNFTNGVTANIYFYGPQLEMAT